MMSPYLDNDKTVCRDVLYGAHGSDLRSDGRGAERPYRPQMNIRQK